MNIKIDKTEHERLNSMSLGNIKMGSHLYGTHDTYSDLDLLCFYEPPSNWNMQGLPNIHQFQYTEYTPKRFPVDHVWTSPDQFIRNLRSGDSTINADIVAFAFNELTGCNVWLYGDPLSLLRTYKIIKAYIGFARRDLKTPKIKNKHFHAQRSLYTAERLLDGDLPLLDHIRDIKKHPAKIKELVDWEKDLRERANTMYDQGVLPLYSIARSEDSLLQKLISSNNVTEFKY